jgi:hypothetical protein
MKQSEHADPQNLLTKALAAGAVAAFRPNLMDRPESQRVIVAAYQKLKEMIQDQYRQVDVDLLDIGPGSVERQQTIAQQLQAAGVTEDKDVLRQAQLVLDAVAEKDPSALWASEEAKPPAHLK